MLGWSSSKSPFNLLGDKQLLHRCLPFLVYYKIYFTIWTDFFGADHFGELLLGVAGHDPCVEGFGDLFEFLELQGGICPSILCEFKFGE